MASGLAAGAQIPIPAQRATYLGPRKRPVLHPCSWRSLDRIQARGPGTDEGVTFRLRPRPMRGTRSMAIADMQFCLSVLFMGVTSTEPWEERRSRLHQAPKRLEW